MVKGVGQFWRGCRNRRATVRDTLLIAIASSLVFPIILIIVERQFPPHTPSVDLYYSLEHKTGTGSESGIHVYRVTIGNEGASLKGNVDAEFMLLFRSSILAVEWEKSATRGTTTEKCEGKSDKLYHYYLRFSNLSSESDFVVKIKSDEHISHHPRLHLDNRAFGLKNCRSSTNEGSEFCEGRSSSIRPYEELQEFDKSKSCPKHVPS